MWLAVKSFDGFKAYQKVHKKNGQIINADKPKVTNVVMMGMGEPLLNFDNVVDGMNLMMDDLAYGLSKRRVTLSTSGVVPMLDKLGLLVTAH